MNAAQNESVPRGEAPAHRPRRVIIDTDPGVDDALAIFLALSSPELQVEALTPVAGNVPLDLTLPNALRLLEIAGRTDVPVAAGASQPLRRQLVTARYAHGENGLGGVQFPEPTTKPVNEKAPELIRRMVRKSPGEITLIAIGPLTNLALAFREDPELPRLLQSIVLMGGSMAGGNVTPAAEFNMYVDPEAAQIVFRSGASITMVGLDVTRKAVLTEQYISVLERSATPVGRAAGQITRAILEHTREAGSRTGPTMHDPLAVATVIDPSLVKLYEYQIEIETAGEFTAGATVGYDRAPVRRSAPLLDAPGPGSQRTQFHSNARVALDLDPARFFKLLIGRLSSAGSSHTVP